MKRMAWIGIAAAAAAGVAAGYWLGMRNAPHAPDAVVQGDVSGAGEAPKKERRVLYYRNPMGLPDTSPVPKKDPMGMDYVPVYEGGEAGAPAGTVKISLDKVQLLGVRTEPAEARELRRTVQAFGTIQANERLLYKVAPRFEGWIEKLHVNTTGQAVARGQTLMEVYSPDLVSAQEEYLIALRGTQDLKDSGPDAQAVMQRLADGVLRRLRNWEISDKELEALRQRSAPQRLLAYRSPVNGVVLQKPGIEGMRFMPGDVLYEIADLSSVWMLADVFEQELGLIRVGQQATLKIVAYPDKAFAGKVVFVYPTLDPATRTAKVRIELPNKGLLLKPAMFGTVELAADVNGAKVLAIPDSAVLDSGARQTVLVQRGEGLFEPRVVKLGMRGDGYVEVRDGVQAGEQVVVRANFLIDAESNLKAAFESFGGDVGRGTQRHKASGTVQAVDLAGGTVEIEHGAIQSLRWPAMTMEFKAKDKALLAGITRGEAVDFELEPGAPGEFVVARIAPVHGGGH